MAPTRALAVCLYSIPQSHRCVALYGLRPWSHPRLLWHRPRSKTSLDFHPGYPNPHLPHTLFPSLSRTRRPSYYPVGARSKGRVCEGRHRRKGGPGAVESGREGRWRGGDLLQPQIPSDVNALGCEGRGEPWVLPFLLGVQTSLLDPPVPYPPSPTGTHCREEGSGYRNTPSVTWPPDHSSTGSSFRNYENPYSVYGSTHTPLFAPSPTPVPPRRGTGPRTFESTLDLGSVSSTRPDRAL